MDEDRNRATEGGVGRVMTCFRSLAALLVARAKETTRILQRRLSRKLHLLLALQKSASPAEWKNRANSYEPARIPSDITAPTAACRHHCGRTSRGEISQTQRYDQSISRAGRINPAFGWQQSRAGLAGE